MAARKLSPEGGWTKAVCQQERWAPKGGGLRDPTLVGEENETFFIRVWKPLTNRHVLKTLRRSLQGKKMTLSTSGGLEILQMVSKPDTG